MKITLSSKADLLVGLMTVMLPPARLLKQKLIQPYGRACVPCFFRAWEREEVGRQQNHKCHALT